MMRRFPPSRIVCLTEETVETLYLLGEQDRIVGVSGYAVRPPQVRREKPRVSAFTSADIPKILALEPDLVLTFSDLQAPIAADLIRAGIAVHAFNQRDIAGILAMIRTLGSLVGVSEKAEALAQHYERRLAEIAAGAQNHPRPAAANVIGAIEKLLPTIRLLRAAGVPRTFSTASVKTRMPPERSHVSLGQLRTSRPLSCILPCALAVENAVVRSRMLRSVPFYSLRSVRESRTYFRCSI
jgi:ABC-type Fe3+-hydroxamate transport system substrate-binding protein